MQQYRNATIAAVQASPILFDLEASLEKTAKLAKQAAEKGANIVVFPESFLPAYPRGMNFGAIIGSRTDAGREDFARYVENSVIVPSRTTEKLGEIARKNSIYLVIGVTERDGEWSDTTLYCSVLFFAPDGTFIGKHRKLKPTASERLIWGEGDGSTMPVFDTPYGKIGTLICWENYMPLARTYLYTKGVQIYLAPTADARESWQATMQHIAMEGRCYVIGVNQYVTKSMYPKDLACYDELQNAPEEMSRGGTVIVDPLGNVVEGPVWGKESIILANLDLNNITKAKFDFDPIGHYARNDVFQLQVNEKKQQPKI